MSKYIVTEMHPINGNREESFSTFAEAYSYMCKSAACPKNILDFIANSEVSIEIGADNALVRAGDFCIQYEITEVKEQKATYTDLVIASMLAAGLITEANDPRVEGFLLAYDHYAKKNGKLE